MRDATGRGWVHVSARYDLRGQSGVYRGDAGPTSGQQRFDTGGAVTTVVLEPSRTAYTVGNARGLSEQFGLRPAVAARLANVWISLVRSDGVTYKDVSEGITMADNLAELRPAGRLSQEPPTMLDGQAVIAIRGGFAAFGGAPAQVGTTVLYVTATADPLPVESVQTTADEREVTRLSGWGRRVLLPQPRYAVPFSHLVGPSAPPVHHVVA